MTIPELLAPAGDLEKLKIALNYGADAVYLGYRQFGLRAMAGNFDLVQLAEARDLCGNRNKKIYLTLNAFLQPGEEKALAALVQELKPLHLDAYIVSDPGAIALIREVDPDRPLHLSTQSNTTNAASANFWHRAGVERVNLARELSLEAIRSIRKETRADLEVFVHGAMCVAYSGRCLLSAALTGRNANQGACAHPCRWNYALMEETRPGQFFPVEEDERGTYLFNSRDLCLIDHVGDLAAAGVNSLKIEGRMKSIYYVAAVTRVYRAALDRLRDRGLPFATDPAWRDELNRVSHRPYGTGFLLHDKDAGVHATDSSYIRTDDFIGIVREVRPDKRAEIEGRNRFEPGETLELMGPEMRTVSFTVGPLKDINENIREVGQPNARLILDLPESARPGDMLRRKKTV